MRGYKRLHHKRTRKSDVCKTIGSKLANLVKWVSVLSVMVVLIGGAIILFYLFIDGNQKENLLISSNDYVESVSGVDSSTEDGDENVKIEGEIKQDSKREEEQVSEQGNGEDKKYDFSKWNSTCKKEMIVINKDNPISDSLSMKTKVCRGREVGIEVYESLEKMISDAKNDGIILWISSGYRSIELQTKLFNRQVQREKNKGYDAVKAEKMAQTVVAKPGTSEHNTGLAIDFNGVEDDFYKTKEYEWLKQHAADYGFIERYSKECQDITGVIYEPWHFRYVGIENAQKIKESGLCLEEYVYEMIK